MAWELKIVDNAERAFGASWRGTFAELPIFLSFLEIPQKFKLLYLAIMYWNASGLLGLRPHSNAERRRNITKPPILLNYIWLNIDRIFHLTLFYIWQGDVPPAFRDAWGPYPNARLRSEHVWLAAFLNIDWPMSSIQSRVPRMFRVSMRRRRVQRSLIFMFQYLLFCCRHRRLLPVATLCCVANRRRAGTYLNWPF